MSKLLIIVSDTDYALAVGQPILAAAAFPAALD